MINAKLFGALAFVLLLAGLFHHPISALASLPALVKMLRARPSDELIVINGFFFWLFYALLCGALALGYFVLGRCSRRTHSQVLGLVGFATVAVGMLTTLLFWHSLTRHYPIPDNNIPLFLLYAAAYNAFYWGCLLCITNLIWLATSEALARIRPRLAK